MKKLTIKGVSQEALLQQIVSEYTQSRNVVQSKRILFRDRRKLYNEQTKDNAKVSVNLLYSNIQAFMALSYTDDLMVKFVGRDYSDINQADIITKVAEFDKEEMNLSLINYSVRRNKFFYGVGIRVFDHWDEERNCPVIYSPNIMTWMPDPLGWLSAENFRWMGFEAMMTKDDMECLKFENIEMFQKKYQSEFYNWNPYNRLNTNNEGNSNDDRNAYYVYHHYTIVNGKKYLISVNADFKTIGRIVEVDSILKDERYNVGNTMRPINLVYYRPEEYNPYGTSVTDLTEDKQRTLSKLLNLAVSKAMRSSLGGIRVYNKDLIPNRTDLANLTTEPKLIGISLRPGDSLDGVISEVNMSQVNADNFNVSDSVSYQNRMATGLDPLTMGISSPGEMSATEAQQMQSNANLLLSYGNVIDFLGEKDFWRKRYKMLKQNLKGKKIVRIINGMGTRLLELGKNDLKTKEDPDIMVHSKNEEIKKNKDVAQNIAAMLGMLPNQPNNMISDAYGKTYATRKVLVLMGLDEDEARVFVPEMAEEIEARSQVMLLNKNIELEPVSDLMEDHDAYISIYRQAIDTAAKAKAIQNRLMAKVAKNKQMMQQAQAAQAAQTAGTAGSQSSQPNSGMAAIGQNQLMNKALQGSKSITTTQDVQPMNK